MTSDPGGLRLADFVAALSLATDLGLGVPEEHVLRQTLVATRLADLAGLSEADQASVFYTSLLAWVGCVSDSHEMARWFGNDMQIRLDSYQVDKTGLPMMRFLIGHLGAGAGTIHRLTVMGRFFAGGFRDAATSFVAHCETTGDIADRLGLDDSVRRALRQAFERWDGKGIPGELRGHEIDPVARVVQIADDAEQFARTSGVENAVGVLRSRRGTEFDPELVDLFTAHADAILADLDSVDAWSTVIEGCRPLDRRIPDPEIDDMLAIFADYSDLKSPWYLGHSRAVAGLTDSAAVAIGLSDAERTLARRAGFVHRLGATGVSTGIWDRPAPWSPSDFERVRTVPYLTERVLSRIHPLTAVASTAAMCHERMDGSGYPRGLTGAGIPAPARLLAAADVYQTLAEDRPGRPTLPPVERQSALEAEVVGGRLDDRAVEAVLATAGHPVRRRRRLVAGLTVREVEVLRLLVRGLSNKRIAAALSVSPRTAATHIEHIYTKTGVSTRGAAAMFALRHGLVDPSAATTDELFAD